MDNARCLRTLLSVCVDMAHNIVTHQLLALLCHIVIDIGDMLLHLVDLFLRNDRLPVLGKP